MCELFLQLVEEPPVGTLGDELLRARLGARCLCQHTASFCSAPLFAQGSEARANIF
jgi:hypothetical protein